MSQQNKILKCSNALTENTKALKDFYNIGTYDEIYKSVRTSQIMMGEKLVIDVVICPIEKNNTIRPSLRLVWTRRISISMPQLKKCHRRFQQ